jgi:hypothetical protein
MKKYSDKVKASIYDLASKGIILPDQVIIAWVLNSLSDCVIV